MSDIAVAQAPAATAPIRDNSFLIEEAYNQEPGVVQHIALFERAKAGESWTLTFTQEWPLWSQAHQLSYSIPLSSVDGRTGLGDAAINYRYRWLAGAAVESVIRASLLLSSGDPKHELGSGSHGLQVALPLSLELSPVIVTHWNAGATFLPSARNAAGSEASIVDLSAGASTIWLLHPNVNLLVEGVWSRAQSVVAPDRRSSAESFIVVPALRAAVNLASGAQIVPGIGFPIGVSGDEGGGVVLYLSFEHAFGSRRD